MCTTPILVLLAPTEAHTRIFTTLLCVCVCAHVHARVCLYVRGEVFSTSITKSKVLFLDTAT